MSKYHITTTKTTMINGIEYHADINKDVNINLSAADYTVNIIKPYIELIPVNIDFLHELTDIFPSSDYNIKIIQYLRNYKEQQVVLYFEIQHRKTGERHFLTDRILLSDTDYDHIRNILAKNTSEYKWQTIEQYLRSDIESYLHDIYDWDMFTNKAARSLSRIVSSRYKEAKTDGYVDFSSERIQNITKEVLEEILVNHA